MCIVMNISYRRGNRSLSKHDSAKINIETPRDDAHVSGLVYQTRLLITKCSTTHTTEGIFQTPTSN